MNDLWFASSYCQCRSVTNHYSRLKKKKKKIGELFNFNEILSVDLLMHQLFYFLKKLLINFLPHVCGAIKSVVV